MGENVFRLADNVFRREAVGVASVCLAHTLVVLLSSVWGRRAPYSKRWSCQARACGLTMPEKRPKQKTHVVQIAFRLADQVLHLVPFVW